MPQLEGLLGPVDLTVAVAAVSMGLAVLRIIKEGINVTRPSLRFLVVWLVLLGYMTATYGAGHHAPYATYKILQTCVFANWSVLAATFVITKREHFERFYRTMLAFAVFCAAYSTFFGTMTTTVGFGAFGGESYQWLGLAAATGLILAIVVMIFTKSVLEQLLLGAGALVLSVGLLLSALRQGVLGLIVGVAFVCFSSGSAKLAFRTLARLAFAVLVIMVLFFAIRLTVTMDFDITRQVTRLSAMFQEEQETAESSGRLSLWRDGISIWMKSPLFGVGYGELPNHSARGSLYPHNYFVESLAELGLIGFAFGSVLICMPLLAVVRQRKNGLDWVAVGLIAVWLLWLTRAMFSGDLSSRAQPCFAAIVISYLSRMPQSRQPSPHNGSGRPRLVAGALPSNRRPAPPNR
jgi:O-antigen ligase